MDTIAALQELKNKKWIDLSHDVHETIPHFSAFSASKEKTVATIEADGFLSKEYTLSTQYSTHIDPPIHFAKGKRCLEELELKELVLPLYVIHKEKEVSENNDYEVTVQDILDFEKEYGEIPSESFVAFSSGWHHRWEKPEEFYNEDSKGDAHRPGWSLEALKFLGDKRNVTAIGHETLDTDSSVACQKNGALIGELYWLSLDRYQIEVMTNLDQVPAVGSIICSTVPKIIGAPGFTIRSFAILPE